MEIAEELQDKLNSCSFGVISLVDLIDLRNGRTKHFGTPLQCAQLQG
jgi:hypothetical protein